MPPTMTRSTGTDIRLLGDYRTYPLLTPTSLAATGGPEIETGVHLVDTGDTH